MAQLQQDSERRRSEVEIARLTAEISRLRRQHERVVDAFIEGVINPRERDRRLAALDEGLRAAESRLMRDADRPALDLTKLIETFAPLAEWEFWTRDQKRQVLSTLAPDIRVANYQIESLGLNPAIVSNESTRMGRGSWRPRA